MKIKLQRGNITMILAKAVCCASIPVLGCVIYCLSQGQSLRNIYLPATASADDMMYYKMVAGMVEFGSPLGYFGYNESHAVVSSFGAWSPVLLMPWAVWGKMFKWGYSSPIICNMCMLAISLAVFSVLAKPSWKQIVSIALLYLSVIPFTTYVLSGRPEIIGYSFIVIMYGIVFSYYRHETAGKLIWIYVIITFLSVMRPYFMFFLLLPGLLWARRSKCAGLLGTGLIAVINLLGYKLTVNYFTAPYFFSLMSTDFIEAFKKEGLLAGCAFLIHKLYDKWMLIRWEMSVGLRQGFTDGQIYFACCIAMLLLFIWLVIDLIKIRRRKESRDETIIRNIILESSQLLSFVAMMLTIIVLYAIAEGSRHILVFLISFILVAAMRDGHSLEKNILTLTAFTYLFIVKYDEPSLYCVPYASEEVVQETEDLRREFSSYIKLNHEDAPNYDNVVDWVIEEVADGEKREIPWKALYALPDGVGISCCMPQYIAENIDELKGHYIIAISNGGTDLLCQEKEMQVLKRDEYYVLYKVY